MDISELFFKTKELHKDVSELWFKTKEICDALNEIQDNISIPEEKLNAIQIKSAT